MEQYLKYPLRFSHLYHVLACVLYGFFKVENWQKVRNCSHIPYALLSRFNGAKNIRKKSDILFEHQVVQIQLWVGWSNRGCKVKL